MNVLLVHPKKARDYSVPVPPYHMDHLFHTTVDAVKQGIIAGQVPGQAFEVIVIPDWSCLLPPEIDLLKSRLSRFGMLVVL